MPDKPLVVIVGAGPAGLAAAKFLHDHGRAQFDVTLIEGGSAATVRDTHTSAPKDIITGLGGAGLLSDGKFSFFPSATGLDKTLDVPRSACEFVADLLAKRKCKDPLYAEAVEAMRNCWHRHDMDIRGGDFKPYPSFYLDFDNERVTLVEELESGVSDSTFGVRVLSLKPQAEFICVECDNGVSILADRVIVATGRFGPASMLMHPELFPSDMTFMRSEVGVRISMPADVFPLRDSGALDPKHIGIVKHGEMEWQWRTFCCCRNGKEVLTQFDLGDGTTIYSYSGRADCPPTGRSNVGFMIRCLSPRMDWRMNVQCWTPHDVARISCSDPKWERDLRYMLGAYAAPLVKAIRACGIFKNLDAAQLVGPCIEGVGSYPIVNRRGETVRHRNIHVAGDACGAFRGIVPALISGAAVAANIVGAK